MSISQKTIPDFVAVLASKSPVPGGGGASALVGALGTALGNMVGSLTVGKKKYADVEQEIIALQKQSDALAGTLVGLIDKDAEDLSRCPKRTVSRPTLMSRRRKKPRLWKNACAMPARRRWRLCGSAPRGFACANSLR